MAGNRPPLLMCQNSERGGPTMKSCVYIEPNIKKESLKELKRVLLKILHSPTGDKVKIAALNALSSHSSGAVTLNNCTITPLNGCGKVKEADHDN